jgi:AcrR family transcriptional regulator
MARVPLLQESYREVATEAEPTGKREANKRRTRAALRGAGLDLFREKGFDRTTIEEIAKRAGVSLRTYFRYFNCKEALLFSGERIDEIAEQLASAPGDEEMLVSLRRLVAGEADRGDDAVQRRRLRRELLATQPSVHASLHQLLKDWEPVIAAGIAQRLACPDDDLRPFVFAQLFTAATRMVVQQPPEAQVAYLDRWLNAAASIFLQSGP